MEYAQRCTSSVPPRAIRRSAITAWLNEGNRKELLSDRMNVSTKTLEKHYDARTESEKRELRRKAFNIGGIGKPVDVLLTNFSRRPYPPDTKLTHFGDET